MIKRSTNRRTRICNTVKSLLHRLQHTLLHSTSFKQNSRYGAALSGGIEKVPQLSFISFADLESKFSKILQSLILDNIYVDQDYYYDARVQKTPHHYILKIVRYIN